ncbi:MAG: hypothetical protein ACREH9_06425 [Pseudomonadota bacterium]
MSGGGGRHLSRPESDACTDKVREEFHFVAFEVFPDKVHWSAIGGDGKVFDEATVDRQYLEAATPPGCAVR